jgi:hypothetical protein
VLAEGGATAEERVSYLYRTVLARRPTADECRIVLAGLAQQQALCQADPERATQLVHTGESPPRSVAPVEETAAWTMMANLILNTDETLNRN